MKKLIRIILRKAFRFVRLMGITVKWTVIVLLGIVSILLLYREWRGPWEDRARDNFNKHFSAFEKLERMQREDIHTFYIGGDKNAGHARLSQKRREEYLRLLDEAHLSFMIYGFDEPKKRMVRFYEEGAHGYGYVYMEYPPPKFFNTFDECEPIMPSRSCFIVLRKNWYLYDELFRLEQTDAK